MVLRSLYSCWFAARMVEFMSFMVARSLARIKPGAGEVGGGSKIDRDGRSKAINVREWAQKRRFWTSYRSMNDDVADMKLFRLLY